MVDYTEAYAVPGEDSIIDVINPANGLTSVYRETLEQIRERYPKAERVNLDEFCQQKAARQDTPIEWLASTEEQYNDMLNCLPPAAYLSHAFLVGEPYDHHATSGRPRYACYAQVGKRFSVSSRPITVKEFKQLFC